MLDIWPNLPIHILRMPADEYKASRSHHESNLITALKRTDRICQIQLKGFSRPELERVLLGMQKPFPALTSLDIECAEYGALAVLPQAFLGGSAQHLRSCKLWGIKFPGIWKLLFTANHLVTLHRPRSGQGNRSVARVTTSFRTGAWTIETNTGSSQAIRCGTKARWSPCSGPQLGRTVVNVWKV